MSSGVELYFPVKIFIASLSGDYPMKKKFIILLLIGFAIVIVGLLFIRFALPGLPTGKSNKPTPLTPPTIKLDLNFEDEDDLKWVQFQTGEGMPENNPQDALVDGAIRLGGENSFSFMGITYDLEPNHFVHFRTRSGGQTCGCTGLGKGLGDQSIGFRLETCTDSLYNISVVFNRDNYGDSVSANLPKSGSVPGFADEWIDEIIWLNESGDVLYYFITNPNTPLQVMYGSVALPEDWQYARWGIGIDGFYGVDENSKPLGYKDIDFIRVGSGSLQSYLTYFIPAYLENQAELDAFFETPAAPMPELLPAPQQDGSQTEDENGVDGEPVSELPAQEAEHTETLPDQSESTELPAQEADAPILLVENDEAITERIRAELEKVLQTEAFLAYPFELLEMKRAKESEDWPDGYCLEFQYTGEGDESGEVGEICFFQDGRLGQSEPGRLDHYQFNGWSPMLDVKTIGQYSRLAKYWIPGVKDENALREYRGAFVKDAWIGDFHLPELSVEDDQFLYMDMINDILDNLPASFSENPESLYTTETQQIILKTLMEANASLPEQYGFTGHTSYMDSWSGAELSYYYDVFAEGAQAANLCLFRDQAGKQPPELRLRVLKEFNYWRGEPVDQDLLQGFDGSWLLANEDNSSEFFLLFSKEEWIGFFFFSFADQQPRYETFDVLGQTLLQTLEALPEDLPLQETDLLHTDILGGSWYNADLPAGYHLGPVFRFDDRRDPQQYIYYQNNQGPVGDIYYFQELDYFTRLAEKSIDSNFFNCSFDGYADYRCCTKYTYSEQVSDPDTLLALPPCEQFQTSIFYNLNSEGLVAFIQLADEEDFAVAEGIGQAIASSIQKSPNEEFDIWDEEVEEKIWSCFPGDEKMLLADFMPAYVRSIQYSSEGYTYRVNYFNEHHPVANTKIIIKAFPFKPSRVDLDINWLTQIPSQSGSRLFYSYTPGSSFDEDIQFHLHLPEDNHMVYLSSKVFNFGLLGEYFPYTWLSNPENTFVKDIYSQLAEEMNLCLGSDLGSYPISLPGEVSREALDESYLRELLLLTDEYTVPDQGSDAAIDFSATPSLSIHNWSARGVYLELWFSREVTGPLTYAVYNVKYDTVLYLQQNKYTLSGDYISTRLMLDRDHLFAGEHILLVWMGDTLIGYEPFILFSDEEGGD